MGKPHTYSSPFMKNPSLSEQVSECLVALLMISLLLFVFRDALWSNPSQNEELIPVTKIQEEKPALLHPVATDTEETALLQE